MRYLNQPKVSSRVSELSKTLFVSQVFPGASVSVFAIGDGRREVARTESATQSNLRMDLLPGVALSATDLLLAIQRFEGLESMLSEDDAALARATRVLAVPSRPELLGRLRLPARLFRCGQWIEITNVFPGAELTLLFGDRQRDRQRADNGYAQFFIEEGIPAGVQVGAYQSVDGIGRAESQYVEVYPVSDNFRLQRVRLLRAPKACDEIVLLGNVYESATVTVARSGGSTSRTVEVGSYGNNPAIRMSPQLEVGETLTAWQHFPACGIKGPENSGEDWQVQPFTPIEIPKIIGPIRAFARELTIRGLIPETRAEIELTGSDGNVDFMLIPAPDDATAEQIWLGFPLQPGTAVRVRQQRCDQWSGWSAPVTVEPLDENPPTPSVYRPLYECAQAVFARGVRHGSLYQFVARRDGQGFPISEFRIFHDEGWTPFSPVTPTLQMGDEIAIRVIDGDQVLLSGFEPVEKLQDSTIPVIIDPVHSSDRRIRIRPTTTGALLELGVRLLESDPFNVIAARYGAPSSETYFQLSEELPHDTRQTIAVRQTLCSSLGFTSEQRVFGPRAMKPIITNPTDRSRRVGVRPTLRWRDSGAGTSREADLFYLTLDQVRDDDGDGVLTIQRRLVETTTSLTSYSLGEDLEEGKHFQMMVAGLVHADGGTGIPAYSTFTTVSDSGGEPGGGGDADYTAALEIGVGYHAGLQVKIKSARWTLSGPNGEFAERSGTVTATALSARGSYSHPRSGADPAGDWEVDCMVDIVYTRNATLPEEDWTRLTIETPPESDDFTWLAGQRSPVFRFSLNFIELGTPSGWRISRI